jgi:hypothetical protein
VRRVTVTFDDSGGEYPVWIDGDNGLVWRVTAIISYWEHPDLQRSRLVPGGRGESIRWRLTVVGPLPGDPDLVGEQAVTLRMHGLHMSWYMTAG